MAAPKRVANISSAIAIAPMQVVAPEMQFSTDTCPTTLIDSIVLSAS
jgi:hypothetical protein